MACPRGVAGYDEPNELAGARAPRVLMKIAILVILFLVGSVGGAMQALKYIERKRQKPPPRHDPPEQ